MPTRFGGRIGFIVTAIARELGHRTASPPERGMASTPAPSNSRMPSTGPAVNVRVTGVWVSAGSAPPSDSLSSHFDVMTNRRSGAATSPRRDWNPLSAQRFAFAGSAGIAVAHPPGGSFDKFVSPYDSRHFPPLSALLQRSTSTQPIRSYLLRSDTAGFAGAEVEFGGPGQGILPRRRRIRLRWLSNRSRLSTTSRQETLRPVPGASPLVGSVGVVAPVAQGIEHRFPKPCAKVRILPGALQKPRSKWDSHHHLLGVGNQLGISATANACADM